MKLTNPKGVKIARVTVLETDQRPDLTPPIAAIYEEIGGAPPTTTLDLLTTLITLSTHAAITDVRRDCYSHACRLGISRTMGDTLALLVGRRSADSFELTQKITMSDLILDQRTALYWAAQASIHCDAHALFPTSSPQDIKTWIASRRERTPAS